MSEFFWQDFLFFSMMIILWFGIGYLPGMVLTGLSCLIFKQRNKPMPRFHLWEWAVPLFGIAINLAFLFFNWGIFGGKSLTNMGEGILTGWCWSVFFVLRVVLPCRRSTAAAVLTAALTLIAAVLIGLCIPPLAE